MINKKKKGAKEKKRGFFRKNFEEGLKYIKESGNFIYIVSVVFLLFFFVGYFAPTPEFLEKIISQFIEELIKKTESMNWAELTSFIFFNNLKSSFLGMIFGIIFGIFSVITSLANGYLLGFVATKTVGIAGISILWRLFPHGVFELPAALISMGLGLRLGTFIFQKNKIKSLKEFLQKSLKAFFFIVVPLLVIAALIEGTLIIFFG